MTVVLQQTGMSVLGQAEGAEVPSADYRTNLKPFGVEDPPTVTVEGFTGGGNSPFDMTKTYKVTIEEEV